MKPEIGQLLLCFAIGFLFSFISFPRVHCSNIYSSAIPNTELFTGQVYTMDNQGGRRGRLTYSSYKIQKDTNTKNRYQYLKIALGKEMPDYKPGGKHWNAAQWFFLESEKEGCYIMVNKAKPKDVITWAGKSPRGKYAVKDSVKDSYKLPEYSAGGKNRDDILWKFVPEKGQPGMYGIYNCKYAKTNGQITWTNSPTPPKGTDRSWIPKHSGGFLWKFTPVVTHVNAYIIAEGDPKKGDDFEPYARRQFLIREAEIINPRKDAETNTMITLKTNLLNSYSFSVDEDLSAFKKVDFFITPVEGSSYVYIKNQKPEGGKAYTGSQEEEIQILRNITLDPGSCVKWEGGYMRVNGKDVNVPMTYLLAAKAYGDGISDPERTVRGNVRYDAKTTAEYMKGTSFKGEFKEQDFSVKYIVKGKMSGDIALKKFMTARNVQCSSDNY